DRSGPVARRGAAEAAVDAGEARLGAAVAVARVADEPQRAVRRGDHQRPAAVALAGVGAALRVAGADLRLVLEVVRVGGRGDVVGDDREVRLLQGVGQAAALGRGAPPGDGRLRPGLPEALLALAG